MPFKLAATAALLLFLMLTGTASATAPPPDFRPFAPDSVWNQTLRRDAPLDPRSAQQVGWLTDELAAHGAWINTTRCAMPTYWADPATPLKTVRLSTASAQDKALMRAWTAVPIPADAAPANCADKNFAVVQPQPDGSLKEWEFWVAAKDAEGNWTARWGGVTADLRNDRGVASPLSWSDPTAAALSERFSRHSWNVTASSTSMIAGVVTAGDVAQGQIDHALSMATPDTAKGRFVWPAQRTDGASTDADALPHGARLRLDPSLDLSTIPMTPLVRMMAEAAQRYGIVLRDRSWSSTLFYTDAVRPGTADPFKAALAGKAPDKALQAFPWSRLQVLAAPGCVSGKAGCVAAEKAAISASDRTPTVGRPVTLDSRNSFLDQPRTSVRWDLDGDGTYERQGGTAAGTTLIATRPGPLTVGVQLTTRSGSAVTGTLALDVDAAPVPGTPSPQAPDSTPAPTPTTAPAPAPEPTAAPSPAPTAPAAPATSAAAPPARWTALSAPLATPGAPAVTAKPAATKPRAKRKTKRKARGKKAKRRRNAARKRAAARAHARAPAAERSGASARAAELTCSRMRLLARIRLAVEIWTTYVQVRWLVLRHPIDEVVARLRGGAAADRPAAEAQIVARRLERPVVRSLGILPWDSRCLMRSLVMLRMMARRGVACDLVLGARTQEAFKAHAWVEHEGHALLPTLGFETLTSI